MAQFPYLAGGNYVPASAVNQLEMWQAGTFDPERIDRELGCAREIGFTTMRVFLHNLASEDRWKALPPLPPRAGRVLCRASPRIRV